MKMAKLKWSGIDEISRYADKVFPYFVFFFPEEIGLLEQTPHSLFWDFDALGYIFYGSTSLVAIPAFEKHGFQKGVRISFLANAFDTPLISIVYFYPFYSEKLLILAYPWAITAPLAMLMLAIMFKKKSNPAWVLPGGTLLCK